MTFLILLLSGYHPKYGNSSRTLGAVVVDKG